MQFSSNQSQLGENHESEVYHSLAAADRGVVAAMRTAAAPLKGKMDGPAARGPFDEMMEQTPDAVGVTYEKAIVGGVPGLWCQPRNAQPGAVILYLHGGAYVGGSANAHRHFVGQIAACAEADAFVPDYRLAPEHPFPAAFDDAKDAYGELAERATPIAIVGDSAGGGLALALLAALHSDLHSEVPTGTGNAPVAGVAMSPWTDLALTAPSFADRADADLLVTRDMLATAASLYLNNHDPRDPLASPLYAHLAGLPPIQIHVGLDEVLLDDARRYGQHARSEGVNVTVHVWEGMPHVFESNIGTLTAASQALDLLGTFVKDRLAGNRD